MEVVPEAVVHEDNDWGISLVDEDLGDAGTKLMYKMFWIYNIPQK